MRNQQNKSALSETELQNFIALRRQIHAAPELGGETPNTAELVAAKLTQWGYQVHRGIGGHGLVGVLKRGEGPRRIGLRADMDALPMQEKKHLCACQPDCRSHARLRA
jgi:metal-dependent amidase/aminoacylase/carboxypeptidase family protein